MYHVPAAQVFSSQAADLVLMLAVAAAMVAHTLRYRSQVVTGLAFLLAFLTVTISHSNVYSLSAGAVLAAGMVVIACCMSHRVGVAILIVVMGLQLVAVSFLPDNWRV
jgi:hypothetical protein